MTSLATRMHPWVTERPIDELSSVPCSPISPGPPAKDATKLRRRVVDASRYVAVTYVERK